jgi:hypothetical protein
VLFPAPEGPRMAVSCPDLKRPLTLLRMIFFPANKKLSIGKLAYGQFKMGRRGNTEFRVKQMANFSPAQISHCFINLIYDIFILTANGFSPGGSGTTIRHNTQTTHITQNNTTINETQYTKIHTQ